MKLWLDAQLSPHLAPWIGENFDVEAFSVSHLGHLCSKDQEIFFAARELGAVVVTKDRDFVLLLEQHGPPPSIVLVTCGNTSNRNMRVVLSSCLPSVLKLLSQGESLVEISDQAR